MAEASKTESNMALWTMAQATDPKYTKQFNRGGFRGTAVNATYIAKRLTEAFGPCGIGWKMVVEQEQVLDGPLGEKLHVIRGHLEYVLPGVQGWQATGPQFGQTLLVQMVKEGTPEQRLKFDEEAPKKSITDCMTKCASLLGFAADIHLGLYDDNKYVNEVKAKFGDDKDKQPKTTPPPAAERGPLVTNEQVQVLVDKMTDAKLSSKSFCKFYDIKAITDLPAAKFDDALNEIAKFKAKKQTPAAPQAAPTQESQQ